MSSSLKTENKFGVTISNLKISNENCSFEFEDDKGITFLNSFRRTLKRGVPRLELNINDDSILPDYIRLEEIKMLFKYIYLNTKKIKEIGDPSKITFILEINELDQNYEIIYSRQIQTYHNLLRVNNPFRGDIPLFTLQRPPKDVKKYLYIYGNLTRVTGKIIGNIGYDYYDDELEKNNHLIAKINFNILEIYNFTTVMIIGFAGLKINLQKFLEVFKKVKPVITKTLTTYEINDKLIDETVLYLIVDYVSQEGKIDKKGLILAGLNETHYLRSNYILRFMTKRVDIDKIIQKVTKELIEKCDKCIAEVNKKMEKIPEFNVIVDKY